MKNLQKVLAMTVVATSLFTFNVFAEDMTAKERMEELHEDGYSRVEIVEILKEEGYELHTFDGSKFTNKVRENVAGPKMNQETLDRMNELKEEGYERSEIKDILVEEGYVLESPAQTLLKILNADYYEALKDIEFDKDNREENMTLVKELNDIYQPLHIFNLSEEIIEIANEMLENGDDLEEIRNYIRDSSESLKTERAGQVINQVISKRN
ncbi:hypothetical protein EZV73_20965 [Acidaminobacter sp. JC074]|uniref:hypothetical protein n=1 Tax=Acidaminobacter sp. JC074 TaxID=2530199 RepID=UPI001F0EDE40|nr:hypothetical protein [Acidaminobacter sp. JC074]MCH4890064.1 hypothetical protein [Acidaminobacter sp. JC074]